MKDREKTKAQLVEELAHLRQRIAELEVVKIEQVRVETALRESEAINTSRLHLVRFSIAHSLDELLEETLNETEKLTGSLISFYHFVDDDQASLTLQNWSTRTKSEFCKAEGKGTHYAIAEAGVWVDCVYQRKPVIHNDYASLPHRKGMPEGHAAVIRELVVPVIRGEKIVAILGVGNKPTDYTHEDVETVSLFADLAWEIAERKRAEERLKEQYSTLHSIIDSANALIFSVDRQYRYTSFNQGHAAVMKALYGAEIETGHSLLDYMTVPEDRETAKGNLDRALAGEQLVEEAYSGEELRSRRYFQVSHSPIKTETGEIIGVAMLAQDMTEHKRAEEALRENEMRYRAIVEAFDGLIYICSQDYHIEFMNKQLIERTGYDGTGKLCYKVLHELDSICPWCVNNQVFDGKTVRWEVQSPKDNQWYYVVDTPIYHTDGSISKQAMILDITERKRAEEALRQAHDEMEGRVNQRTAELRRANEQLTALYQVGQVITAPLQLQVVLDVITRSTVELLGTDTGVILLVDEAGETLTIQGAFGLSEAVVKGTRDRVGESIAGRVVQTGRPMIANDLPNDPRFYNPSAANEGLLACASVPLVVGGKIIGTLDIHSKTNRHAFNEEHIHVLNMLASQAAIAIENARLYEQLQLAHDELEMRVQQRTAELAATNAQLQQDITERKRVEEALRQSEQRKTIQNQIANIFLTIPDEDMYGEVLAVVLRVLESKFGVFGFIDVNGDLVIPSMTREIWDECQVPEKSITFPSDIWGQSLWGRAIREKAAYSSNGPFHIPEGHIHIDHFLTAPIVFGNETIGLISVANNEHGYTEEDKSLLENITSYISPILNARLQRDRQEQERRRAERELQQSNELLRAIIEAAPTAIIGLDLDGNVQTVWNPAAEKMLGWSAQEVMGRLLPNVPVESQEELKHFREQIRSGLTLNGVEIRRQRRDGSPIDYSIYASPLHDAQGRITGNVAVLVDITERKKAEMQILASEQLFRALVENSPDFIARYDREFRRIYVNPAIQKLFGTPVENVLNKTPADQSPVYAPQIYIDQLRQVIETATECTVEMPFRTTQGEMHWGHMRFVPEFGPEGQVASVLAIGRDIHEIKESERRFRTLAENFPDFVVRFGRDCRYTYVNPAVEKAFGLPAEAFTGKTLQELPHHYQPEQNDALIALIRRAFDEGVPNNSEAYWDTQIGKRIFEIRHVPEKDATGNVVTVLGIAYDITERKRAEKERERLTTQIREQAWELRHILATVPEGVLLLDSERRIVQANPVAERDLAILAGVKVGDVLTHLGDRSLAELLTSPLTKGLWHEVKADQRIFEVIARPMENDLEPEHWVLVINDVTQAREVREQLQQQERMAAVGQLAAGIAHDFNNIMAIIILYAQMTAQVEALPAHVQERMVVINQQARHATRLIQQILDFSRRSVLERQPLDLLPLLKEQCKLLERTLPENIEISLDYEPVEYIVNADLTRIQQVMMNLAVNARDAMPKGGKLRFTLSRTAPTDKIRCVAHHEIPSGEWVSIAVTDTGGGIPSEVLPHIFEPFFTTKAPGQGTGLGLSQVYGIVGAHEGHIDVSTKIGEGTTFTIYLLPLLTHQLKEPVLETLAFVSGRGETLLVVEDDAILRKVLAETLISLNYRVLEAANGQEALDILRQSAREISLVISDLVMPGMGGQALFHAMRQRNLTLPVIMLSGHPMEQELQSLQAEGLAGWLLKPPDIEQLSHLLAQVLKEKADRGCVVHSVN